MLNNVRYVTNLGRKIISAGTPDMLGYKYEGGDGKVKYYKNNKTTLRGTLVNGLYVLDGDVVLS